MESQQLYRHYDRTGRISKNTFTLTAELGLPLEWCSIFARTVGETATDVECSLNLTQPIIYAVASGFDRPSFRANYNGPCHVTLYPEEMSRYYYDKNHRRYSLTYGRMMVQSSIAHELYHAYIWEYDRGRYIRDIQLISRYGHDVEYLLDQEYEAMDFAYRYATSQVSNHSLESLAYHAQHKLMRWLFNGMADQYRKKHPELADHY